MNVKELISNREHYLKEAIERLNYEYDDKYYPGLVVEAEAVAEIVSSIIFLRAIEERENPGD